MMTNRNYLLHHFIFIAIILICSQNTAPAADKGLVERLQKLSRLQTVQQTSRQIVEAKSNSSVFPDFLAKDSLQMVVQTVAIGGVDLSRIEENDIKVEGDRLLITLPEPEVFDVHVDDSASHVFARERGLLLFRPDKDLERQARLKAQANAREIAASAMNDAKSNAEENLRRLLGPMGFADIQFEWAAV